MYGDLVPAALKRRLQIDTRSLAVFRILAGVLIVVDVLLRARDFRFFYTDEGVLPVEVATGLVSSRPLSILFLSGDPTFTAVVFAVHALVAVQLLLGYYTRVATVVSFLLVVSLDFRNPLIVSYADTIFRLLLFWGIFLPLGARYSVDAIRRDRAPSRSYAGLAGAFALLQMVFMYLANGSHKIPYREAWLGGDAMVAILHYDSISFLLGDFVREYTILLHAGGVLWYSLMLGSPLLLLLVDRLRYQLALVYASGHLALALTVRIGAFPYAAIMGLTLFFQAAFWDDASRIASLLGVPVDRFVDATRRHGEWLERRLPRVAIGERVPPLDVVIERGAFPARVLVVTIVLVAGLTVVVPNLQTVGVVDDDTTDHLPEEFEEVQPPWRFYQGPVTYDAYYVFVAETADGEVVDAFNDRTLAWDRPHGAQNHRQFDTYRHRFFMYSIAERADGDPDDDVLEHYQRHLCETYEWNGSSLDRITMYYVRERGDLETIHDYTTYDREAYLIDVHGCGDAEAAVVATPPPEYVPSDAEYAASDGE